MRLSEAIRLGAMTTEQTFLTLGRWQDVGAGDSAKLEVYQTCTLGAACHAVGMLKFGKEVGDFDLYKAFPILSKIVPSPIEGAPLMMLGLIVLLNDTHMWTREKIADWVEGIENGQEPKQEKVSQDTLVAV